MNTVSSSTLNVWYHDKENQKNNQSNVEERYIIDFGVFFAQAKIDVTFDNEFGTFIGCSQVKNVFFLGYGILLEDNNTSKEGIITKFIQEPSSMAGVVIFQDIAPTEEFITIVGLTRTFIVEVELTKIS